jgi:hypothetical protein
LARVALTLLSPTACPGQASAQDYRWLNNPQLVILVARLDPDTKVLRIKGENFGLRLPQVTLDGMPLPLPLPPVRTVNRLRSPPSSWRTIRAATTPASIRTRWHCWRASMTCATRAACRPSAPPSC